MDHRVVADQGRRLLPGLEVPQERAGILAGGSQLLAIRTESEAGYGIFVTFERADFFAGGGVPDLDVLAASGRDCLAVRPKREAAGGFGVRETPQFTPGGGVPNLYSPVVARGREPAAVGAKGESVNEITVPQPQAAKYASNMLRKIRRQRGEQPASTAVRSGCLQKTTGSQGGFPLFGQLVGLREQVRCELARQSRFLGGCTLRLVNRLEFFHLVSAELLWLVRGAEGARKRERQYTDDQQSDHFQARRPAFAYPSRVVHGISFGEEACTYQDLSIEGKRIRRQVVSANKVTPADRFPKLCCLLYRFAVTLLLSEWEDCISRERVCGGD